MSTTGQNGSDGRADRQEAEAPRLLRDIAYEHVKDAIRYGELLPGEPLSETRLSEALETSRTPVREALQQLAQEGLVQIIPGRTVTVAAPSMQEVMDVVHMRFLLAPEVARLAAESVTPQHVETLWEALQAMEEAAEQGDRTSWSKADTRLHETLSDACPNVLLGQLTLQMRNRIQYQATDSQTTNERIIACTREHRAVIEGIAAKDPQAAEEAMREHINQLRESLFRRLAHY